MTLPIFMTLYPKHTLWLFFFFVTAYDFTLYYRQGELQLGLTKQRCEADYFENLCDGPDRVEALHQYCEERELCLKKLGVPLAEVLLKYLADSLNLFCSQLKMPSAFMLFLLPLLYALFKKLSTS